MSGIRQRAFWVLFLVAMLATPATTPARSPAAHDATRRVSAERPVRRPGLRLFRWNRVEKPVPVATNSAGAPPVVPVQSTAPSQISVAAYRPGPRALLPQFTVDKVRTWPTNRPAEVGERVEFQVTVTNIGIMDLLAVPIEDTYDTRYLAIQGALPPTDDVVNDGRLNWADLGLLSPGNSATVMITFVAVAPTVRPAETNVVVVSPTVASNEPVLPPQTSSAPYAIVAPSGSIGDTVWVDLDKDGLPDEDLSIWGLNQVTVCLYRIINGEPTPYATQVTSNGPGAARGYYLFTGLPYGQYCAQVVLATVPRTLNVPTTPLSCTRAIGPPASHQDADFGFITGDPYAVELTYFTATDQDCLVALAWGTAWERDTLGFNLYRATSLDGARARLNGEPVPGQGAESGFDYQYNDATVERGVTYFYWLEEVETDGDRTGYGPVAVRAGGAPQGVVGSYGAHDAGIHRITYETLLAAGIPASQIDTAQYHVMVDGTEAAALVMASGRVMGPGEFILFLVHGQGGDRAVSIVIDDADPLRMEWVYVEPLDGDGATYTATAENGVARFTTEPTVIRYLLTGFDSPPLWIFDVTDPVHPKFLFGAAEIIVASGAGTYFSYLTEGVAHCVAMDDAAVMAVTSLER